MSEPAGNPLLLTTVSTERTHTQGDGAIQSITGGGAAVTVNFDLASLQMERNDLPASAGTSPGNASLGVWLDAFMFIGSTGAPDITVLIAIHDSNGVGPITYRELAHYTGTSGVLLSVPGLRLPVGGYAQVEFRNVGTGSISAEIGAYVRNQ